MFVQGLFPLQAFCDSMNHGRCNLGCKTPLFHVALKLFPVNVHLEKVCQLNHAGLWKKAADKTDKSQVGRD